MQAQYIDINCDMGEGLDNEVGLMPLISSCNLACGGHAGNEDTMRTVARLAKDNGVKVGAHPSYPDLKGFGRISMPMADAELAQTVRDQVAFCDAVLKKENIPLHHIKPHGALYNDLARDAARCAVFLGAIGEYRSKCTLYVPFGSVIEKEALKAGFAVKREAFADRNYGDDGDLLPRNSKRALIQNPVEVLQHLLGMVLHGELTTASGKVLSIRADTYCVHGDTPRALEILTYLSEELAKHHIHIAK